MAYKYFLKSERDMDKNLKGKKEISVEVGGGTSSLGRSRGQIPPVILDLSNEEVLASTFTRFFKECGFFVRTKYCFSLGDRVQVKVTIPGDEKLYEEEMVVVLVVPKNAEGGLDQGVGLTFEKLDGESSPLFDKIDLYLQGKDQLIEDFSHFPFPS